MGAEKLMAAVGEGRADAGEVMAAAKEVVVVLEEDSGGPRRGPLGGRRRC